MIIFNVRLKNTCLILIHVVVLLIIPLSSLTAYAQESSATSRLPLLSEVDTTPPTIANVSPTNGKTITENTTLLSASLCDTGAGLNLSTIVFKLNGQALDDDLITYMHGQAFTYSPVLPNGTHTLEIFVTDLAGNVAHHTSLFYVHKSVWPAGSSLLVETSDMHSVTLTWTAAEESTGYRIYRGSSLVAEVDDSVLSYKVEELRSSSYYSFTVEAVLEGGGWTTDGPYVMAETLPLPHFPPTIWSVYPETGVRVDTANPEITASIRAAAFGLQVESILLKIDNRVIPSSYDAATMTLTAAATGLADGYHSLLIRAADNQGIYEDYLGTFEVHAIWPMGSSLSASPISPTSQALSWTPASSSSGYRILQDGVIIGTLAGTVHAYEIDNLSPNRSYTFKIESKRPDGVWTTDGPAVMVHTDMLPNPFLERISHLHTALAAGAPSDMQAVRNLRDEWAGLRDPADERLMKPIWSKISAKLPAEADKATLKSDLFQIIKASGSIHYDSLAADLDEIRANEDFRAALRAVAAAGGQPDITLEDFAVFLIGDGDSRRGLEGTIVDLLAHKPKRELAQLLVNKQKQAALLRKALNILLHNPDDYKISGMFNQLNVTSADILATVNNFRQRLQYDEPALRALAKAYVRALATENAD